MKVVHGDLLTRAIRGEFDVIIHGCNCMCAMGAGIAASIATVFPEAYEEDCRTESGARQKLGTISVAEVERYAQQITVVNAYTQYDYSTASRQVDYDAVRAVMRTVKDRYGDKRIGYPQIGAGLAGGDWKIIAEIIDDALEGTDHTLVKYKPE